MERCKCGARLVEKNIVRVKNYENKDYPVATEYKCSFCGKDYIKYHINPRDIRRVQKGK